MDNIWIQIAMAVTFGMMLFFLYPRAKHWMENGPKAQEGDWMAAVLPILAVVGFVLLLIALV
jgi:archaellum biogenesis protein FlaJ (TadC family)